MGSPKASNIRSMLVAGNKRHFLKTGFDQKNVEATTYVPLAEREYGFVRASKSGTPFPTFKKSVDAKSLFDRLKDVRGRTTERGSSIRIVSASNSPSSSEKSSESNKSELETGTPTMTFEMKRKLFDEGEFTITRGKKLSEQQPEAVMGPSFHRDTQFASYKEMEAYCRQINIRMHKGFVPPLY